jgi:hypothetical protein
MSDFQTQPKVLPSVDLSATNALLASGSPRGMYVYFLLACCRNYFEVMRNPKDMDMEAATLALIAFCPSTQKREELWEYYTTEVNAANGEGARYLYASIHAIGSLVAYLSESLEFIEEAHGALL